MEKILYTKLIQKSDFISKLDSYYLFKSCGWLHEKDINEFIFSSKVIPVISSTKRKLLSDKYFEQKEIKQNIQTTLFDFI